MKLYWFETMNPRKVCTTAKHLGLELDYQRVDLARGEHKQPEHLRLNPNGRVPVLTDGDKTLWESAAICVYLASKVDSAFWPREPAAQAEVMRWVSWGSLHWAPAVGAFYFEHYVKRVLGMGPPDLARLENALPQVHALAKLLDDVLADRTYLANGELTLGDVVVGAMLPDWQSLHMPLERYTHLRRWHDETLMRVDAHRDPWPRVCP